MKRVLIALVNLIIVAAVVIAVVIYVRDVGDSDLEKSRTSFQSTVSTMEEIANNYMEDSQTIVNGWADYIESEDFTMDEALESVSAMNAQDDVQVHLIWADTFEGVSSAAHVTSPYDNDVTYASKQLSSLFSSIEADDVLHMTHRYANPIDGSYVVAFCELVTLKDSGADRDAILMRVVPLTLLEERWTFPTEYGDSASIALIDAEGNYIIKPSSMKNETFYDFIYSYNKGSMNADALKEEVNGTGSGSFTADDNKGEECFLAYHHLQDNYEWVLMASIPVALLSGNSVDWTIPIMVMAALLVLLMIDLTWYILIRKREKKSETMMLEQKSIIDVLSTEYTTMFILNPENGQCEIYRKDAGFTEKTGMDLPDRFPYANMIDTYVRNIVHPEDRERLLEQASIESLLNTVPETGTGYVSFRRLIAGEEDYYQLGYGRISEGEHKEKLVLGMRDVTEMVKTEQEREKQLREALAAAQHANNAKSVFLSNMSHDTRTPMNAIIGFTTLAAAHIDNKEQVVSYLGKIQTSSDHLLSLINDVLDMSRIESGKVQIEEGEVRLPDILHDLRTIIIANINAKQQELYIDTLDVEHENVITDKLRLNQVLLNLLSNAIKFTPNGGTISVRVQELPSKTAGRANYEFRVKDTGIGMEPEFAEHVFEAFTREQSSTVSGIQGTGLGMAITKNIVDMMGGTITVNSKKGVGTEFVVNVEFEICDEVSESRTIPELEGLRALVADDDSTTAVSVAKMLGEIGMRADWTLTGKEAVLRTQIAKEENDSYAAYIIDWLMPDMNGIETIRRIRRIIGSETPIIVLTAYDWAAIEEEAREAGVTAFCSKPLFMSELRRVLANALKKEEEVEIEAQKEDQGVDLSGKNILLVEDNEFNREIAVEIISAYGCNIDTAEDGDIAVEKISQAAAGRYDLVLMDIQMPRMDGYQATRLIRALPDRNKANIPIVAMTANAFEEDKKKAFEAGMNGHLAKPIDIGKLQEVLKDILE